MQKVKYQPKDLEKEAPETVERLQFFREPFIFARDQMPVFVKTLTETVTNIFEDGAEEDEAGTQEAIVIE